MADVDGSNPSVPTIRLKIFRKINQTNCLDELELPLARRLIMRCLMAPLT
jgi:hypothetical protein